MNTDKKAIAAMILGCKPGELMSYRDFGTFVSVVGPDGGKHVYTTEHLEEADSGQRAANRPAGPKYIEVGGLKLAAPAKKRTAVSEQPAKKTAAPPSPDSKKPAKRPAKKPAKASNPTKAKK